MPKLLAGFVVSLEKYDGFPETASVRPIFLMVDRMERSVRLGLCEIDRMERTQRVMECTSCVIRSGCICHHFCVDDEARYQDCVRLGTVFSATSAHVSQDISVCISTLQYNNSSG